MYRSSRCIGVVDVDTVSYYTNIRELNDKKLYNKCISDIEHPLNKILPEKKTTYYRHLKVKHLCK